MYDTVIQELLLTLGLLVGFLSLWLRRERALEDPQQSWPSESSSGPCEITKHTRLTTILTIRVIIRALWNNKTHMTGKNPDLSESSSGPCQSTIHTQLTTILTYRSHHQGIVKSTIHTRLTTVITIKVNNRTCCRSASLTIIFTIKIKPHLLWTTQLPSSQQLHLLWYTQLTAVTAIKVNNHTKGPVVISGSGRVGGGWECVCVCVCECVYV